MPIRTLPFPRITNETLLEMKDREIPEDRTLDYKREIAMDTPSAPSRAAKLSFVSDVTAMANAAGGTILYGAAEGVGDQRGRIVDLPGMDIEVDGLKLSLAQALRDSVQERLDGVEMHAVRVPNGNHCLLVRVPASSLAPHMITTQTSGPRFYQRGTVNNEPMDVRQIKEVAMRTHGAAERVGERLRERANYLTRHLDRIPLVDGGRRPDAISVHFMPLTETTRPDLSSDAVLRYVQTLPPAGAYEGGGSQRRIRLDGVSNEGVRHDGVVSCWTMILRGGGVELVSIARGFGNPVTRIGGEDLERQFVNALAQIRVLVKEGLVSMPALLALRLENVDGLTLVPTERRHIGNFGSFDRSQIILDPELVAGWEDIPAAAKRMLDVLWQAAGYERSPFTSIDGAVAAGSV